MKLQTYGTQNRIKGIFNEIKQSLNPPIEVNGFKTCHIKYKKIFLSIAIISGIVAIIPNMLFVPASALALFCWRKA